jgi:signal transduction histidine kinase
MKTLLIFVLLYLSYQSLDAQAPNIDSLKQVLTNAKDDSRRFDILEQLFFDYLWSYPDSSVNYVSQANLIAERNHSDQERTRVCLQLSWFYLITGDYPRSLQFSQDYLGLAERTGDLLAHANAVDMIGEVYDNLQDYEKSLSYRKESRYIIETHWKPSLEWANSDTAIADQYMTTLNGLAPAFEHNNELDSALSCLKIVDTFFQKLNGGFKWSAVSYEFGNVYAKKGYFNLAHQYYTEGVAIALYSSNGKDLMDNYNGLANLFRSVDNTDSSIYYAKKVLEQYRSDRYSIAALKALALLAGIYKSQHKSDSVAKYLDLSNAVKDSLFNQRKIMEVQSVAFKDQLHRIELADQKKQLTNMVLTYSLLAGLLVFLIIGALLYRNNLNKQKSFALLQKQKQETELQKEKVENTLADLKSTQAQLIQSEKMASLGEITAGIAHEIQNPLNFINNFAQVNEEFIEEAEAAIRNGQPNEAMNILHNLKDNQKKINQHGQRADSIVKGMLQHSRSSSGQKEPTDINALVEEYSRLSYHGWKAKDKSANIRLIKSLDPNIRTIYVVQQDIGRVILNLLNNAFYAVMTKAKTELNAYEPTVTISTIQNAHKLEIIVKDNGNGVPRAALGKMFQPFFTTKPTGQGTGLGLSISYDIIKAHGGDIKIESSEGEFATFIVLLPLSES